MTTLKRFFNLFSSIACSWCNNFLPICSVRIIVFLGVNGDSCPLFSMVFLQAEQFILSLFCVLR